MGEFRGSCYPGRKMTEVGWCFRGWEGKYLVKYPGRTCWISYEKSCGVGYREMSGRLGEDIQRSYWNGKISGGI